eukprot:6176432-Pleurochrysis_carterae.AAC.9
MEMASLARVLLLLLAGEASALRHFASGVTSANAMQHLAVSRAASVQMVDNPWNEPILDESLPGVRMAGFMTILEIALGSHQLVAVPWPCALNGSSDPVLVRLRRVLACRLFDDIAPAIRGQQQSLCGRTQPTSPSPVCFCVRFSLRLAFPLPSLSDSLAAQLFAPLPLPLL